VEVKKVRKKIISLLLVFVVFCGVVALVGTASTVDATGNMPKLSIRVSDYNILEISEAGFTDHWLYVTNPSWNMERPPFGNFHNVTLNQLDLTVKYPNGTSETFPYMNVGLPTRWNPTIKPGETVLVFYLGYYLPDIGIHAFTYTIEAEYEDATYILEKTVRIRVSG
jgi:hypothetical protein